MPVSRQKAEDSSEIGAAPPLNGHTLDRSFRRHKKHHRLCEITRKNGASFEINRERQRTDMLNRKYFDNLRQQQALSGRVEEPRAAAKEQNGSAAHFEPDGAAGFDTSKIKLSPSKLLMTEPSATKTEDPLTTDHTTAMVPHSSNGSSSASGGAPCVGSLAGNSLNRFDEVMVKKEPGSGGSTPVCLHSPPLSGGSTAGSKAPPTSLPFPPSTSSNGRFCRSLSTPDAKRLCCSSSNNSRSPIMDEENDLKLKPYDFLNNVIKTPPLKPLEEGDDPPITPSPTSVGPLVRRPASNPPTTNSCVSNHSNGNHSNPPSTPTTGVGGNGSTSSSQMAEDLNEFYRVMEQVREREKERHSVTPDGVRVTSTGAVSSSSGVTSTQIDMYSSTMSPPPSGAVAAGATQKSSPPPYNAASGGELSQRRFGGKQLQHVVLTSPTSLPVSPPLTAASAQRSLYTSRTLVGQPQHAPPSSLALQQTQTQGQQSYPSTTTHRSLTASEVMNFSANPSSLHGCPQQHTSSIQHHRQVPVKPQQCVPLQHQSMQLSHLNQGIMVSCPGGATPTPAPPTSLTNPVSSNVYYNSSQSQPLKMHTSAPISLPPQAPSQQHQTPLTPTTPLGHFSIPFPSSHSSRVSPTHHPTNPLYHQTLHGGHTSYTYTTETPHVLSNHGHLSYIPPSVHHQPMQIPRHAATLTTNSWGGSGGHARPTTQQLAYKDTMMAAQHANAVLGRSTPLPHMQQSITMSTYPPHLRMGQLSSLQHHASLPAPPPAYLQLCGSNSHHGNAAATAFSGLPFP